jgi:hypothetical protein
MLIKPWSLQDAAVPSSTGTFELSYLDISLDCAQQCQQTVVAADGSLQVVCGADTFGNKISIVSDLTRPAATCELPSPNPGSSLFRVTFQNLGEPITASCMQQVMVKTNMPMCTAGGF